MNFNGPDQRLPRNLVGQFTYDQLFFLSFAQVWPTYFKKLFVYAQYDVQTWGNTKDLIELKKVLLMCGVNLLDL